MSKKFVWPQAPAAPEQRFDLSLTDPDTIMRVLAPKLGPVLAEMIRENAAGVIKEMGLDRVDRRYLQGLPGQPGQPGYAPGQQFGTKPRFTQFDCIDRRGWDIPEIRAHRAELMRHWFRFAVCGTPLTHESSLGPDADATLIRTLSTTDSEGGTLIPPGFIYEVTRDIPKLSQLFQYVRVMPVPGLHGVWPKVGTNARVYWGTENQNVQQGDPSFTEDSYTINRMNVLLMLSREIVSDSNPDIVNTVTTLFQLALIEERDRVIAIGSGSGKPTGLYSASGIIDTGITTLTYANLVNMKHSIDQRYHYSTGFRWTFNQNVLAAIEKITDTIGDPIFRDATANMSPTVLGVPFSVERAFPNNYIGIGDLGYYAWFDRQQMGAERTTEGGDAFINHQVWLKWFERVDGKPILPPTTPMARSTVLTGVTALTADF